MRNVLAVVLLSALAWAQAPEAKKEAPPPVVRKVLDVKHLSGDRAERAVNLVRRFMHPSQVDFDPVLRTVVMIGPTDVVAAGEALFRKFDTPGGVRPEAQVQFRLHLIEASPDGDSAGNPPEVAAALEQMKRTFAYKGYRLLDTLLMQGRGVGEVSINGTLPGSPGQARTNYYAKYRQAEVLEDGKTIVVRGFNLSLRMPISNPATNDSSTGTAINSDFTISAGQKLVIGKMSSTTATNAIFVIVTADVQ